MTSKPVRSQSPNRPTEPHTITISRGGVVKAYRLSPVAMTALVATATAFGLAYLGATAYLFFRDDLMDAALSRQSRLQGFYEDRIASLRQQIDKINSRQMIDQDAFDAKIDKLLKRQESLDQHQAKVTAVVEQARQQGLKLPAATDAVAGQAEVATPSAPPPIRASTTWLTPFLSSQPGPSSVLRPSSPTGRLSAVESSIDRLSTGQIRTLDAIAEVAEKDAHKIEKVVGRLGFRLAENDSPAAATATASAPVPVRGTVGGEAEGGVGGPMVPMPDASVLQSRMERAERAMQRLVRLKRSIISLPLGLPTREEAPITSGFGSRTDPFLGVPAVHTGIDFRAEMGEAVIATAPGVVTDAGRLGGYGIMVEIDHGNGIATRYGHLSRVAVENGDKISVGSVIGYAGSTGRSTGPHLHYETRVNGEAVNPMVYLEARDQLRGIAIPK